jgi:hypothetical protein
MIRVAVPPKRPFSVRHPNIENPSVLKNTKRLCQEMWHFLRKFEVLERVFTVNMDDAIIWEGPTSPYVELQIGR